MKGAGRKWKTERLDELKETLEQAAQRMSIGIREEDYKDGFIDGANWQVERMYSEEEVLNILVEHTVELFKGQPCTLTEFFEQFKKK